MSDRHWIASYGKRIPAEIDANAYPSVVHLMDAAIGRYRDRSAFRSFRNALSFGEFDAQAQALAAFLQQRLGVKKGDRVAVMLPNVLAFPIALLGIARAGAVQVNVNPQYTPRELEHQLNDAGVETIIVFNGSTPTLAERVRSRLTNRLGNDSVEAMIEAVDEVQDNLRGRTLGPPDSEFLRLLCAEDQTDLRRYVDGVTPTKRTRTTISRLVC